MFKVDRLVDRGRCARGMPPKFAAAGTLLALGGALVWSIAGCSEEKRLEVDSGRPGVELPAPPRPVPPELRRPYAEIHRLQRERRFRELVELYPELLRQLEVAWGAANEDLAKYYYDFSLALKLAGRRELCIERAEKALETWPGSLRLQVLAATTRAAAALERSVFDPRADELFESCLRPAHHPRLRGLRLVLPDLYALWGELLLRAPRAALALERAETGLELESGHAKCLGIKARALLLLYRPQEARALFRELDIATPAMRFYAGMAEERSGDFESAWTHYSKLLEGPAEALPAATADELRMRAATVLNRLGRSADALDLLAGILAEEPDDARALSELVRATRALRKEDASRAIQRRIRRLLRREDLLEAARKARAAQFPASGSYFEARAAEDVHRLGEALEHLERGLGRAPALVALHLERARVRLLLGRHRSAELLLRRGLEATGSGLLAVEMARVQAMRGDLQAAHETLARPEASATGAAAGDAGGADVALAVRRARVALELGELAGLSERLSELSPSSVETEERDLCLAELALREGRLAASRELLSGSFHSLPEGDVWARTLRSLLEQEGAAAAAGGALAARDPSDLLDHPRLFTGAPPAPLAASTADILRELHRQRTTLLERLQGYADRDVTSGWRELLGFYRQVGAARKAREVAWLLVHLEPGAAARLELARTLSAPEEAVVRFSVLRAAARLDAGSVPVRLELAAVSEFVGWTAR